MNTSTFLTNRLTLIRVLIEVLIWFGCIQVILVVSQRQLPASSILCGPWGCGPSLFAVATYHLLWVALFSWPVLLLRRHLSLKKFRTFQRLSLLAALFIIGGIMLQTLIVWLPQASPEIRGYWPQRIGFDLVTNVDLPIVGLLLWAFFPDRAGRKQL